jgi:hypothetical protein
VLVKIPRTVARFALVLPALSLALACTRPAKEYPAGSAPSTAQPPVISARLPPAGSNGGVSPVALVPVPVPSGSSAEPSAPAAAAAEGSSAYLGCGLPIPTARLWDETSESEVLDAISAAKTCAAEHGRRLLLEFVAPWCADCKEMAKLDEAPAVAATLEQRFERVRVNVGKWDRHEALRESFGVRALATYIVIDPKTSKQLAKTTLEPITKPGKKLTADDWARWLKAH